VRRQSQIFLVSEGRKSTKGRTNTMTLLRKPLRPPQLRILTPPRLQPLVRRANPIRSDPRTRIDKQHQPRERERTSEETTSEETRRQTSERERDNISERARRQTTSAKSEREKKGMDLRSRFFSLERSAFGGRRVPREDVEQEGPHVFAHVRRETLRVENQQNISVGDQRRARKNEGRGKNEGQEERGGQEQNSTR
jgi:hypothetical protein